MFPDDEQSSFAADLAAVQTSAPQADSFAADLAQVAAAPPPARPAAPVAAAVPFTPAQIRPMASHQTGTQNPTPVAGPASAGMPTSLSPGGASGTWDEVAGIRDHATGRMVPLPPRVSVDPRTGAVVNDIPLGKIPGLDLPILGVEQAAQGVAGLAHATATARQIETTAVSPKTGTPYRTSIPAPPEASTAAAASDVIEGSFKAASPALLVGAALAPVSTAAGIATAVVAGKAAEKGVAAIGGGPEAQRLVSNIVQGVVAAKTTEVVRGSIADAAAAARANAGPPDVPVEPRPVGRGATVDAGRFIDGAEPQGALPAARPPEPPPPVEPPAPAPVPPPVVHVEPPAPPPVASVVPTEKVLEDFHAAPPDSPEAKTAAAELARRGVTPEQVAAAAPAPLETTTFAQDLELLPPGFNHETDIMLEDLGPLGPPLPKSGASRPKVERVGELKNVTPEIPAPAKPAPPVQPEAPDITLVSKSLQTGKETTITVPERGAGAGATFQEDLAATAAPVAPKPAPRKRVSFGREWLDEMDRALTKSPETPTKEPDAAAAPEHRSPLAGAPAADGQGVGGEAPAPRSDRSGGGPDVRRGESPDPQRDARPAGPGADGAGVGVPAERERPAEPPAGPRSDHRIESLDLPAGDKARTRANLAAVTLLKELETSGRTPTDTDRATLARYVGWGGLSGVFKETHGDYATVKAALTPKEYESARASTPNAHYTSEPVIRAIYSGLQRLGVSGKVKMLEPAAGVGHFLGLMPEDLARHATRTAVELDSLSGRITQQLYPNATVHVQGFQEAPLRDDSFDVVVSNVPFGNYQVFDKKFKGRPPALSSAIHNYYFAKALDLTRPGGLVAFVTSRYTADAQDSTVRRYLGERADMVGAIRLPNTAFKSNAGTEVVTDVLFLQKRGEPRTANEDVPFLRTEPVAGGHKVNAYYHAHPTMVLGTHSSKGSMYGAHEYTVEPSGDLPAQLAAAVAQLPQGVYAGAAAATRDPHPLPSSSGPSVAGVREHAWIRQGDQVFVKEHGQAVRVDLSADDRRRVHDLLDVRDAVRTTLDTMLSADATDAQVAKAQKTLNTAYDGFVKRHGYLAKKNNLKILREDPDVFTLLALEEWAPKAEAPTKAAIFTKRTLRPRTQVQTADTPKEALLVSLNETGAVDWGRMAALTGQSEGDLQAALDGLVFEDPESQEWEPADRYLSGNVKAKLKAAKAAGGRYAGNVRALDAVQPVPLEPADIAVRLGAPWVPGDVFSAFAAHLGFKGMHFAYMPSLGKWSVDDSDMTGRWSVNSTATWGTTRRPAPGLIEQGINLGDPIVHETVWQDGKEKRVVNQVETLAAREKLTAIQEEFKAWVWSDPTRSRRLAGIYNDTMNTSRLWVPDGAHLTLPGLAASVKLRPHQKNFIWRGLQEPNVLAHHVVGAGKTFAGIALAMEKRRLGLARKPMVVVPNHLPQQWARDVLKLYPGARVLASEKNDFEPRNRKRFLNRIATGDWDLVIVPYTHFGFVSVTDDTFNDYLHQELANLETEIRRARDDGDKNDPTVKELEKAKLNLEGKLRKAKEGQTKDETLSFEQLGVDMLVVDEAHNFKKLGLITRMTRVAGVPAGRGSDRAFDLFIKSRWLQAQHPTGGLVFLTGTPISNTMAEMFVLMRYLAQPALDARGIPQFDGWAATFGEKVTALELSPTGRGFRSKTRFARFTNLPELVQLYRAFADVQTADMLKLPTPPLKGGKAQMHVAAGTAELDRVVEGLIERMAAVMGQKGTKPDPSVDNPLKITTEGRKAALDLRLLGLRQPAGGKVDLAADAIAAIYTRTTKDKGTQLVFADLGAPAEKDDGRFTVYDALRTALVGRGIPRDQVRFIHEAKTDLQKQTLFDQVKVGDVRVLVGSTEKMGAGTNVQDRLVALHHLDAPWRPSDIEQREGRILRQGNALAEADPAFEVEIHTYISERSFDAYLWQLLENKARFIKQALKGDLTSRETDDADDVVLNMAQMKGAASGNPAIMEHAKTQADIQKLEMSEAGHWRRRDRMVRDLATLPGQIDSLDDHLAQMQQLQAAITLPADRAELGLSAEDIIKAFGAGANARPTVRVSAYARKSPVFPVGHVAGVDVRGVISTYEDANSKGDAHTHILSISAGEATLAREVNLGAGAPATLWHLLESGPAHEIAASTKRLAELRADLDSAQREAKKPFAHAAALKDLRAKLKALERELNLDAKSQAEAAAQTGAVADSDEADDDAGDAMRVDVDQPPAPKRATLPGPKRGPPVANATLVPGAREFLDQDVIPGVKQAAAHADAVRRDIRALFAPDTTSPSARLGAGNLRAHLAAHTQRVQRAQQVLHTYEKQFHALAGRADAGDAAALAEFLRFTDAMEGRGAAAALPAWQRDIADVLRDVLTAKRRQVQTRGKLLDYLQDYFPHEWAKPSTVKAVLSRIFGKRPLQGSKAFLKHRTIPTTRVGVEKGLTPASYNPVTLVLHKLIEMDKFLLGHDVLEAAKNLGIATFVRAGTPRPPDWVRYPESFGTVYGPPVVEVKEAYDAGLMEAIHTFATALGIRVVSRIKMGKNWGYAVGKQIDRKVGGPEGVLMHEIGHVLDRQYGLGEKIGIAQADERVDEENFGETPSATLRELRALADLRTTPSSSKSYRAYVRRRSEQIANLVHAFLYVPEQAKAVAPNAYWALYNLAKETPALGGLLTIRSARSLRIGESTHEMRIDGMRVLGHYYGPRDAVRLLENHLSPGLRGNVAFDLYRRVGNLLNAVQLGLSAFHVTMVSLEAVVSKNAQLLQLTTRGEIIAALKTLPQVPVAPLLDLMKGHRALREFYQGDANAQTIDGVTGLIIQGGGGVGWDKFWHDDAPEKFLRTLRSVKGAAETGNYLGATARLTKAGLQAMPASLELLLKPVMEWYVPRLKLGAYLSLAEMELRTLGPNPALPEVRRVLGDLWDSIDNRFGELRYDNLFWHNALKDLGMASVRALGWSVGTAREVFGAPSAQLRSLGLLPSPGGGGGGGKRPTRLVNTSTGPDGPRYTREAEPLLHQKFAYLLSLLWIAGLSGGVLMYLLTGERPQEARDYFFPRTGRKRPDGSDERVQIPSYSKDIYAVGRDFPASAIETAKHKVHPLLTLLSELTQNEDFFGTEIRNPRDPLVTQLQQVMGHIVDESKPIFFENVSRELDTFGKVDKPSLARSFFGITPAPASVSRTDAESTLHRLQKQRGLPTLTREQGAAREARREIRRETQQAPRTGVDTARDAVQTGTLTPRQAGQAVKDAGVTALERGFRSLSLTDALDVYEAGSPEERGRLRRWLASKAENAQTTGPTAAALQLRLQRAAKLPATTPRAPVPVAAR